jgi:hypothetical protein
MNMPAALSPRRIVLTERSPDLPRDSDGCPSTTGRPCWVRADAIDAVICEPARNAVEVTVYLRRRTEPIPVCEQDDDILCELNTFADERCACRRPMPEAGTYGDIYSPCQLPIAGSAG